jgi:hypothetical protein
MVYAQENLPANSGVQDATIRGRPLVHCGWGFQNGGRPFGAAASTPRQAHLVRDHEAALIRAIIAAGQ